MHVYFYESSSSSIMMTLAIDVLGRSNEYATSNRLRCWTETQRHASAILEVGKPTKADRQQRLQKCKGQETSCDTYMNVIVTISISLENGKLHRCSQIQTPTTTVKQTANSSNMHVNNMWRQQQLQLQHQQQQQQQLAPVVICAIPTHRQSFSLIKLNVMLRNARRPPLVRFNFFCVYFLYFIFCIFFPLQIAWQTPSTRMTTPATANANELQMQCTCIKNENG